jgi:hypothetical protein
MTAEGTVGAPTCSQRFLFPQKQISNFCFNHKLDILRFADNGQWPVQMEKEDKYLFHAKIIPVHFDIRINLDKSGSGRAIDMRAHQLLHLFWHTGKMHSMHAQNLACLWSHVSG